MPLREKHNVIKRNPTSDMQHNSSTGINIGEKVGRKCT